MREPKILQSLIRIEGAESAFMHCGYDCVKAEDSVIYIKEINHPELNIKDWVEFIVSELEQEAVYKKHGNEQAILHVQIDSINYLGCFLFRIPHFFLQTLGKFELSLELCDNG